MYHPSCSGSCTFVTYHGNQLLRCCLCSPALPPGILCPGFVENMESTTRVLKHGSGYGLGDEPMSEVHTKLPDGFFDDNEMVNFEQDQEDVIHYDKGEPSNVCSVVD